MTPFEKRPDWSTEEGARAMEMFTLGSMKTVRAAYPECGVTWLRNQLWRAGAPMKIYRKVTDEEAQMASTLMRSGMRLKDVAKRFGMPVGNLGSQLCRRGIKRQPSRQWRTDEVKDFRQACLDGDSLRDLQKRFARTRGSVLAMRRRLKIPYKRKQWTPAMRALIRGRVDNMLAQIAVQLGVPETAVASKVVEATINRQKRLKFARAIAKAAA